ncbi:cytochrome P450 [Nakamurella flavida]|uniref:Cytochrome P450 n=1 Tax=Nakamurella flavida TaxID=363630 RepID=A0A938YG43_9ACTN|nr:cytochrome P450 [Nakamurella flavida]MBM9477051.1 cytochrome P450 [Nakamurella flavida]MDP9779997.1 unspecific monooxygenase [Nakamurella flavida]
MSAAPTRRAADDLPTTSSLGFDPTDPAVLADPYPVYARLRAAGPLVRDPGRDSFLLTRFADVNAALRDRRLGRAYAHRYTDAEFGRESTAGSWPRWEESERWSLLNLEPPDHTRLRRLVTAVFTARAVAALRPQIERISADTLRAAIGRADAGGTFDLITDYAQPYSVTVICALLGVPPQDGPALLGWSHAIVKMYELALDPVQQRAAEQASADFIDYVTDLIEQRRRVPADDLVSELVTVADGGDRLTPDEIIGTVIVLLNAGHEATVNTLGNGIRALLAHRDQWDDLVAGRVDPAVAVEELIRWDGPLQLFERWVLEDGVEYGGRTFAVGERIGMLFGSANRDPERFEDPDRFDIARGVSTHIGFGGGIHFCIGAPLARLEIGISLAQLAHDLPGLTLAQDTAYHPTFVIRGLTGLRVHG